MQYEQTTQIEPAGSTAVTLPAGPTEQALPAAPPAPASSDPEIVARLKAAAQDSLDRGFAILTCEPQSKNPWAQYSPHAVNSCSRVPDIALRPWQDGHPANYGVGGGPSNLTIIDVDKGIPNYEALKHWMEAMGLPDTLIVQSGRTGFGAHLYYSGAVPTTPYDMDGVVGELRGIGAYVVGPGSIHPDGNRYQIINDVSVAPLPDKFVALAAAKKKAIDFKVGEGELIKEGNRWNVLQVKAGQFKAAGIVDEDALYVALKSFTANYCENGANYPDEKIKNLAEWAASDKCEAGPQQVVIFGEPKPIDTSIPELPSYAVNGDWLGELSHLVTDGTFIPLSFARAQIKTILGASVDGLVGFPGHTDLHTKHFTMLISVRPESGKGESWKRTGEGALANYLDKADVKRPLPGWFSSGEFLIRMLGGDGGEFENKNCLVYFDEMKTVFDKGSADGSTLIDRMTELFDRKDASAGSNKNKGGSFKNISLSFTGGFTVSGFESSFEGKGSGGSGFMSRCVLEYTKGNQVIGDWPNLDAPAINAVAEKMLNRLKEVKNYCANNPVDMKAGKWIPQETDEAKALRFEFKKALAEKGSKLNEEYPTLGLTARLYSHFERDLLLRVLFSDDPKTITADAVKRSIAWAGHQLLLRESLWTVDKGGSVVRMERKIVRAYKKQREKQQQKHQQPQKVLLTRAQMMDFCKVYESEGGINAFNTAFRAMKECHLLKVFGTTNRGTERYEFTGMEEQ